ncbi:pathogenesis-related transcriptional factor and ERF protein [Burkholderia phage vB_BpP_HN03]
MSKRIPVEAYAEAVKDLIYDPASPSGLRWANGKPAGGLDGDGYWLVRVGKRPGRLFKAHRLIWFIHHGTVPDLLDHEDTNTSNNRIGNLRIATEKQNRANSHGHKDSSTGVKGVYYEPRTNKYTVRVTVDYQQHWGGRHSTIQEATAAATALRERLHKEFARHD